MDESPERRAPRAGSTPGGYLPRRRHGESESEPAPQETKSEGPDANQKKGKRKKKKAPSTDHASGTPKGVLVEETPVLDTIEARRTVRLVAGSVATLLIVIFGLVLFRVLTAKPVPKPGSDTDQIELVDIHGVKQQSETEAETLYDRAREADRRGNQEQAIRFLRRVCNAYPESRAAEVAREALARPVQHLPLFPEGTPPEAAARQEGPSADAATAAENRRTPTAAAPSEPAAVPLNPEAALAANNAVAAPKAEATTTPNPASAPPVPSEPPPLRALPSGFQARTGVSVDPSGWPLEIVSSRDGAMMVLVPGGPFVMGRDGADAVEAPAHLVKVSTFYIDKHEVTNRQFEMFLKDAGPRADRNQALAREGGRINLSEDYPVVMVSAKDARAYADWAGKRLPTEAQWEKAARGTDQRPYPWGVAPPVWVKPRAPLQVDSVMSFPNDLSPCGAYDLAGNVMEWTRDWYDPNIYAVSRGVTVEDPIGPSSRPPSVQVAVRGCSRQWRITEREGLLEGLRLPYLGFRCVLPVEGLDSINRPGTGPEAAPPGAGPGGANQKGAVPF